MFTCFRTPNQDRVAELRHGLTPRRSACVDCVACFFGRSRLADGECCRSACAARQRSGGRCAPSPVGESDVTSMARQTSTTVVLWAISCSAVLSLRMICSAVWRIRFMVKSPAQSGRMRTLIHRGPNSGGHVRDACVKAAAIPEISLPIAAFTTAMGCSLGSSPETDNTSL